MLLIGGYTHYPVGIPAKAGEGVALFREENNTVEKIIPAENPSFLASDGSGGFFALKESDSGLLQHFVPNSSEGSFSSAAKIAFPGAGSCHLCVKDGKTVYVSNYLSGTLSVGYGYRDDFASEFGVFGQRTGRKKTGTFSHSFLNSL